MDVRRLVGIWPSQNGLETAAKYSGLEKMKMIVVLKFQETINKPLAFQGKLIRHVMDDSSKLLAQEVAQNDIAILHVKDKPHFNRYQDA